MRTPSTHAKRNLSRRPHSNFQPVFWLGIVALGHSLILLANSTPLLDSSVDPGYSLAAPSASPTPPMMPAIPGDPTTMGCSPGYIQVRSVESHRTKVGFSAFLPTNPAPIYLTQRIEDKGLAGSVTNYNPYHSQWGDWQEPDGLESTLTYSSWVSGQFTAQSSLGGPGSGFIEHLFGTSVGDVGTLTTNSVISGGTNCVSCTNCTPWSQSGGSTNSASGLNVRQTADDMATLDVRGTWNGICTIHMRINNRTY